MHFTRLLFLLLLSVETPIIASAQLVERQEVWPAARNAGGLLWGTLELLKGTVDLFSGSDSGSGSDSSKPDSPTNTDNTPSNRQPSPNAPSVQPASPNAPVVEPATPSSLAVPSLDASPSTGEVYKLRIDNSQNEPLLLPGLVPNFPGVMPTVKKQCDSMNVSPLISAFFTIFFQRMTRASSLTNIVAYRQLTQIVTRPQTNSFSP